MIIIIIIIIKGGEEENLNNFPGYTIIFDFAKSSKIKTRLRHRVI